MTQQQSTNTLSEDTRGIGRSIIVGLLGVALVGFCRLYIKLKCWSPAISRIATTSTSFMTQDGTSFRIRNAQSICSNDLPDYYNP